MTRNEALATLRHRESDLRARGVRRAAVFGSVARGDNRPDSDLDIMVEIDPGVNRDGLKPAIRPAATADAVYAF